MLGKSVRMRKGSPFFHATKSVDLMDFGSSASFGLRIRLKGSKISAQIGREVNPCRVIFTRSSSHAQTPAIV